MMSPFRPATNTGRFLTYFVMAGRHGRPGVVAANRIIARATARAGRVLRAIFKMAATAMTQQ